MTPQKMTPNCPVHSIREPCHARIVPRLLRILQGSHQRHYHAIVGCRYSPEHIIDILAPGKVSTQGSFDGFLDKCFFVSRVVCFCHETMVATMPYAVDKPNGDASFHVEPHWHSHPKDLRVICVGAGAAGLLVAYKMKKLFSKYDLVVYDKNPSVAGTWYENRYPGCACDV